MNLTSNDLKIIYNPYFFVLQRNDNFIELQSKNTRNCWKLIEVSPIYYDMYHKHNPNQEYHYHYSFVSIEDCLLEIADHDEYLFKKRKPIKYKNTFFDYIMKTYSNV